MGLGGISIWQLLIILVIVVLLFGTKRLRGLGSDLGSAVRGFRKSMRDVENDDKRLEEQDKPDGETIDASVERDDTKSS